MSTAPAPTIARRLLFTVGETVESIVFEKVNGGWSWNQFIQISLCGFELNRAILIGFRGYGIPVHTDLKSPAGINAT